MGCKPCLLSTHLFVALLGRSYRPGYLQRKHRTVGGLHRNTSHGLEDKVCVVQTKREVK